jgi:integrase
MPRRTRTAGTRAPNGASTIYYSEYDGKWHGRVTMGIRDNGKPDRRHIKRRTESEVISAVRELERQRANGTAPRAGRPQTVAQWLTHWVEHIAAPAVRYKTLEGYRTAIYNHLIPRVGDHRLNKALAPELFERAYAAMLREGFSPGTVHQVHRTARTAFREAHRRRVIGVNPFTVIKAPRVDDKEIEPFTVAEVRALMTAALARRNGVRFVLALALGTRKGETLGFRWSRLDSGTKVLWIRTQRQRHTYRHGCPDPVRCAAPHHKVASCADNCRRHRRTCPPPCPAGCVRHARYCPRRKGGVVEVDVKSKAGRRGIRLPDPLFALLEQHRQTQNQERQLAGTAWHGGDWMFTQSNGTPLDPRADHDEWKALLVAAGVRDARLHDARHTAATVLLLLGVPERAVMEFMGWSQATMAHRYQHVTAGLRDDIADRLSGFLWQPPTYTN